MWSSAREIAAGDLVIVWMTRDNIQPLVVTPGKDFNSRYGNYRQSDFVGVPYGSKVRSRTARGFIYLLRPTPELWTLALPHRTQILYLADIAFIISRLNIRYGSRVIEAGTGSGSFTHSVARTIGESGHLWSYEFHEARANKAREEFTRHGMTNIVTLTHRNVCREGFTVVNTIDSVFLDLPAPWDAVDHAKKALRKDRITRICCFSPCMEQVIRTVTALNDAGFTEITMYETLLRPHEVAHIPQLQSISEVSEKLKEGEKRREGKRLRQIANNKARLAATSSAAATTVDTDAASPDVIITAAATKRKRGNERNTGQEKDDEDLDSLSRDLTPSGDASPDKKRVRTEESQGQGMQVEEEADMIITATAASVQIDMIKPSSDGIEDSGGLPAVIDEPLMDIPTTPSAALAVSTPTLPGSSTRVSVSNAFPDVRGHTSYLTFAVLVPFLGSVDPSERIGEQEQDASSAVVPLPSEPTPKTDDVSTSAGLSEAVAAADKDGTEAALL